MTIKDVVYLLCDWLLYFKGFISTSIVQKFENYGEITFFSEDYIEINLSIVLSRNRVIVRKSQTSNIWVNADTALSRYVKKYSTYFNRKDVCAHLNIYFRVDEQRHIVNRLRSRQPLFLFLKKGIKYIDHLESITFTLRLYYDFQQIYCFSRE